MFASERERKNAQEMRCYTPSLPLSLTPCRMVTDAGALFGRAAASVALKTILLIPKAGQPAARPSQPPVADDDANRHSENSDRKDKQRGPKEIHCGFRCSCTNSANVGVVFSTKPSSP